MQSGAECIGGGDGVAAAAQKMRDLGVDFVHVDTVLLRRIYV